MNYRYVRKTGRRPSEDGGTEEKAFAEITGTDAPARFLEIPEEIGGLRVASIGDHAFSGRKELEEVRLPSTVRKLGRFCFYDCESLKRLELTDAASDIGDGTIRECGALREIYVHLTRGSWRVVRDLAEDSMRKMRFTVLEEETEPSSGKSRVVRTYRFLIPAWHPEDREDTHARAIHPKIVGAGYAYRQTVTRTEFHVREYDSLFEKAEADGVRTASEIALLRLSCPEELSEEAEEAYTAYLKNHADEILLYLAAPDLSARYDDVRHSKESRESLSGKSGGLFSSDGSGEEVIPAGERRDMTALMLQRTTPGREAVAQAADAASRAGETEICSMLLDYEHRCFGPSGGGEIFIL